MQESTAGLVEIEYAIVASGVPVLGRFRGLQPEAEAAGSNMNPALWEQPD